MDLKQIASPVQFPALHYLFVEKRGPFQETAPQAWQLVHKYKPAVEAANKVTAHLSLYKNQAGHMTYRAGLGLAAKPVKIPEGLEYTEFPGGTYAAFVLKGSYSQLPMACGEVFAMVSDQRIKQRPDFCIEHYVNDPNVTPEAELITHILVPTF